MQSMLEMLRLPFMQRALLVGTLAALCAALWLHTSFAWQDLLGFAAILVMAVLIALPERASAKVPEKAED
mgnify:CR=1 FL=1